MGFFNDYLVGTLLLLLVFNPIRSQELRELTILFPFDKSTLSPAAQQDIDSVLKERDPLERIDVLGHTDTYGTENYNLELSQKRALSVRSYLVARGIDRSKIDISYFGENKPLGEEHKLNRRVEMIIRAKPNNEPCVGTKKYVMQRRFPIDLNDDEVMDFVITYLGRGNESLSSLDGELWRQANNEFLYASDKRHIQLKKGDTIFAQPPTPFIWTFGNLHLVSYKAEEKIWETKHKHDPTLLYVGVRIRNKDTTEIGWMKLKFDPCTGIFKILEKQTGKDQYLVIDK